MFIYYSCLFTINKLTNILYKTPIKTENWQNQAKNYHTENTADIRLCESS